jgi:hypothetical protein
MGILAACLLIAFALAVMLGLFWFQLNLVPPHCPICEAEYQALFDDQLFLAYDEGWIGASLYFCPHRRLNQT